ncbi:MAG: glycosyltransferase [Acidimicrobiales bacterium]
MTGRELSVVVCTRNRVGDLRRGLPPLLEQLEGVSEAELLVVDNGSTDGTSQYLDALARDGALRALVEPILGLIPARNAGWRAAVGRIVAYLDDDAVVEPGWVPAVLATFGAGVVGMAGRIRLGWPARRPTWLPAELESLYSGLDLGGERKGISLPNHPYGANMAVLRTELEAVGGFSGVGRSGGKLYSNDEIPLFSAIEGRGDVVVYEPAACVVHHVAPSRVSVRWLMRRSLYQGRSDARLDGVPKPMRSVVGSARPRFHRRSGEGWAPPLVRSCSNTAYWMGWAVEAGSRRSTVRATGRRR